MALSTQLLADVGPSPANRLCSLHRLGVIRARRGEPGAWKYLDEAAALGRRSRRAAVASCRSGWPAPRRTGWQGEPDAARREAELAA